MFVGLHFERVRTQIIIGQFYNLCFILYTFEYNNLNDISYTIIITRGSPAGVPNVRSILSIRLLTNSSRDPINLNLLCLAVGFSGTNDIYEVNTTNRITINGIRKSIEFLDPDRRDWNPDWLALDVTQVTDYVNREKKKHQQFVKKNKKILHVSTWFVGRHSWYVGRQLNVFVEPALTLESMPQLTCL